MATHIISFRISDGPGYADRWASVVAAIDREAADMTWKETTSFYLLHSPKTATALADAIYLGSDLSPSKDILLVVDATHNTYAARGAVQYPATLGSFFPSSALGRALLG